LASDFCGELLPTRAAGGDPENKRATRSALFNAVELWRPQAGINVGAVPAAACTNERSLRVQARRQEQARGVLGWLRKQVVRWTRHPWFSRGHEPPAD
jgi:hypothetical protein